MTFRRQWTGSKSQDGVDLSNTWERPDGRRQAPPTSVADIDRQIEALKEKRKQLQAKAAERFAKLAAETGLAALDLDDDTIREAFRELAARFRQPRRRHARTPVGSADQPAAQP